MSGDGGEGIEVRRDPEKEGGQLALTFELRGSYELMNDNYDVVGSRVKP